MKKIILGVVATVLALGGYFWGSSQPSLAQSKSYNSIIPFITASGRVCFFDQSKGKIYIYDNDLTTCLFIGELDELGKPLKIIKDNSQNQDDKNLEYHAPRTKK